MSNTSKQKTYIKLCHSDLTTRDGYQLRIGGTHRATGERGQGLCSDEYIHSYPSGPVAALMAPLNGVDWYDTAVEITGKISEIDGTKLGHRQIRVLRQVPRPTLTTEQRVAIAIVCASRMGQSNGWTAWTRDWLSGRNRSKSSAEEAWAAAAATWSAAEAAWAAARSAEFSATKGVNLVSICDLVLATPESEWEGMVSDE